MKMSGNDRKLWQKSMSRKKIKQSISKYLANFETQFPHHHQSDSLDRKSVLAVKNKFETIETNFHGHSELFSKWHSGLICQKRCHKMAQLALITDRYNARTPKGDFSRPAHGLYSNSKSKTIHISLPKPRGLLGFPIPTPLQRFKR